MAYLILDESTHQYLDEEYDAENIAMAAANRHARETGHDASVWVGDRDDATNTGYYAEAGHRGYEALRTIGVIRSDGVEKESYDVYRRVDGLGGTYDGDDHGWLEKSCATLEQARAIYFRLLDAGSQPVIVMPDGEVWAGMH